ncbi:MAG TPA: tryptophan synthase subunit alpha [Coriobacteriia bacterium]|nr:tryptophan synthase subunit alpha [Coriobacteriia bacterium]
MSSPGAPTPSASTPAAEAAPENPPVPALAVSRLRAAFQKGRPALITYVMAGYPDRRASIEALRAAARGGADVIELGVPYGDPLADGPVIAEAAAVARAGEGGFGLVHALQVAAAFIRDPGVDEAPPVVAMTYMNPVMRLGLKQTAERMLDAGIAGAIIPDMPPEASAPWRQVSAGLDTVFLTAPTSTDERLAVVAGASAGFVYCVSSMGVTGERESLAIGLADQVARVKRHTDLPVAVGFGVGDAAQAAQVAAIADGVIVGSAIVRRQSDPVAVESFVRELAAAVRG